MRCIHDAATSRESTLSHEMPRRDGALRLVKDLSLRGGT